MLGDIEISMMAACGENNEIGGGNDLLWGLKSDLQLFKNHTSGHDVVMGRKTFESFNKKPLPNRRNIVLTTDEKYEAEGCIVIHNPSDLKDVLGDNHPFIIGGEKIYRLFLPYADNLYLTRVHGSFNEADTFFPEFDSDKWAVHTEMYHPSDSNNDHEFTFYILKKEE